MKKTALQLAAAALAVPVLAVGLALPAHAAAVPAAVTASHPEAAFDKDASSRAKEAAAVKPFAAAGAKYPWLGPATGPIKYSYFMGTLTQLHKNGALTAVPSGTVYPVKQAIWDAYLRYGSPRAQRLNYATSAEIPLKTGGSVQHFAAGDIHWTAKGGAHHVVPKHLWAKHGGMTGRLGYPTSDWIEHRGGAYQTFKGGKIILTVVQSPFSMTYSVEFNKK